MSTVVRVVDDDASFRSALERLLVSAGFDVRAFESAEEFLKGDVSEVPGCLVLDVRMPGTSGLELQHQLASRETRLPIVFLTGHGDVPMSTRAMKSGAVDFLTKPVDREDLLAAVQRAIAADSRRRARLQRLAELRSRLARLTPREREVMSLVVRGMLNKQIAAQLGTAEHTIKVHRGRVMQKLELTSVAELVVFALELGLITTPTADRDNHPAGAGDHRPLPGAVAGPPERPGE